VHRREWENAGRPPIVTLLTDFGSGSGYPAQMKGVLLAAVPSAQIVDLSHEVARFDVLGGALLLEACVPRFPVRAVHCAVVDPEVGTARRPLCVVDGEGRRLVGPDNGLFTPFLREARCWTITTDQVVPPSLSATFHGRDLFAPAVAYLANGGDPERLGPGIADPIRLDWPDAVRRGDIVEGVCLRADTFGNMITSIREDQLAGERMASVLVEDRSAHLVRTFGEGRTGELLAMLGSGGRLELAVREGDAVREHGLRPGMCVRVRLG
jgi:S-adenosyl-L-methionine hydrolase (adenosine-forming)